MGGKEGGDRNRGLLWTRAKQLSHAGKRGLAQHMHRMAEGAPERLWRLHRAVFRMGCAESGILLGPQSPLVRSGRKSNKCKVISQIGTCSSRML